MKTNLVAHENKSHENGIDTDRKACVFECVKWSLYTISWPVYEVSPRPKQAVNKAKNYCL